MAKVQLQVLPVTHWLTFKTIHLTLGFEPMYQGSNMARPHSLPTNITHLISGLNEPHCRKNYEQKSDR